MVSDEYQIDYSGHTLQREHSLFQSETMHPVLENYTGIPQSSIQMIFCFSYT